MWGCSWSEIASYGGERDSLKLSKVLHMVDSEIVQAMIQRDSYGFNTFAANRIGEIH